MARKKKPEAKKPTLTHSAQDIIRHAFEQIKTRAARLSSFASATTLPSNSDIITRQNQLAIDDLVTLAMYTRRMIENSGKHHEYRQQTMPVFYGATPKPTPIIRVINILIHHDFIYLFRTTRDFERTGLGKASSEDILRWIQTARQGIPPAVAMKSDQGELIGFRVATLVDAVIDEIVDPLVDYCADCGLYLEDMYNV